MIIILIGKSGCGKDSLRNELVNYYGCKPIISCTSRQMRPDEQDGKDYHFISKEEFERKIKNDSIFEHRAYESSSGLVYYGAEIISLDKASHYVKVLDVDGANAYIKAYGRENCFVVNVEVSDEIRFKRAFAREFGTNLTSGTEMLSKKEKFCKEWETRLEDDAKQFSKDRTESIVNFDLNNEGDLIETADLLVNAINTYDYELQDYRDIAERRSSYECPLLYLDVLNNESCIYVKDKSQRHGKIKHSCVEEYESLSD